MRYLLVIIVAIFLSTALNAQIRANINFNIGNQPVWGPTGNDYVENYYMPDIDGYYNVSSHLFYFNEGGRWVGRSTMPARYHDYDLYNSHKVVINERNPWRNHEMYRDQYSSYKGRHDQQPIRDSHDSKYFVNKNHPQHNNWVQQQKHDNGNHYGQDKGNGRGNNGNGNNGHGRGNNGNGNNGHDKDNNGNGNDNGHGK